MTAVFPHASTSNTWLMNSCACGTGSPADRYVWTASNEVQIADSSPTIKYVTINSTGDVYGQNVVTSQSSTGDGEIIQQIVQPNYSWVQNSTNLTYRNFIGISKESGTDGAQIGIASLGSSTDAVSSLTAGTQYFIDPYSDGSLVTSISGKYPRVVAGTALTTGSIVVGDDVSGYSSIPKDTNRIFCGSYDFRRQGDGDDSNVLISLPAGINPKLVRAYDIQWYGIGFNANNGYMKIKAYNGTSNIMTGSWYGKRMTDGGHEDNATIDSPYVYLLTGRGTYVNAKANHTWEYEGSYRRGTNNTYIVYEKGIAGGAGGPNATDYADGFYFYASAGTNFVEGVVTVYAIMNAAFDTIDLIDT